MNKKKVIKKLIAFYKRQLKYFDSPLWKEEKDRLTLFHQAFGATEYAAMICEEAASEISDLWSEKWRQVFFDKMCQ